MRRLRSVRALLTELFSRAAVYQGRAILVAVYLTVIGFSAMLLRLTRTPALQEPPRGAGTYWRERPPSPSQLDDWSRQY